MKLFLACTMPILALLPSAVGQTVAKPAPDSAALAESYGKLPLSFEPNQGQSDSRVKFQSRGDGYSLFLTDRSANLVLTRGTTAKWDSTHAHGNAAKTDVIQLQLDGAAHSTIVGEDALTGKANYFIGNDPEKWQTNVPTYARVRYAGVYPGIDLAYYGNQRQLEYDFIVAPHARASAIQLHFAGAQALSLDRQGDLVIHAANGSVAFRKPVIYQQQNGERQAVAGSFELLANNSITFKLGKYDHARELVIDPTLQYSTYLGSTGSDVALGLDVDASGNSYVTGYTLSTKFPTTTGSYQPTTTYITNTGDSAVFVSKLNAAGSALVYSTYIAGTTTQCNDGTNYNATTQGDFGSAIQVDSTGDAYIAGGTCSSNFPTTASSYQPKASGGPHHATNAFITKLNATGSALVFSTYLGGSGILYSGDWANALALDASNNIYVTGQTSSTDFPVSSSAYKKTQPDTNGKNSAFVSKLSASGSSLLYSTYLGGSGNANSANGSTGDNGWGIAVNPSGDAYVTGYSYSSDFPVTSSAYQKTNKAISVNGANAFVTELNSTGSALVFSTYVGGLTNSADLDDSAYAIALDSKDDVYIAGGTSAANFPVTTGAYKTKNADTVNGANAFITKLSPTGSSLLYSTYLGGTGHSGCGGERAYALALDAADDVYVTGTTCSNNFPVTTGAYQTTNKGYASEFYTGFLTEVNPTGSALLYSTYFGGTGGGSASGNNGDSPNAIVFANGNAYLAGYTFSTNFPVSSAAYQKTTKATSGNTNAFIAKFAFATATTTTLVTDGTPQKLGVKVTFTADVTPTAGSGTPTGTVDFSVDGGTAVAATLDDTGHAEYATTTLKAGVHSVVASYLGDATHIASTSAKLSQTIYGPGSAYTVVSGSAQTSPVGTAFKLPLVVLVKDAEGDVVPGVVVTYSGTSLKFSSTTATTAANGEASVTATPTAAGSLKASASASIGGTTKVLTFTLTATTGVSEPTVSQTITIADATSGAVIYYTTDGSTPTTSSKKYTGPVTITASETLKFIATHTGDSNSAVRTVTDTIQ